MPGVTQVQTTLNGEVINFLCEPRQSLLEVLRDVLGMTGTKEGCNDGNCGACTIMLDGRIVDSCLVLGVEAEGRDVTTIEGMASPEGLHPLQQSFLENAALQCGICTPGFLIVCSAFMEENPEPTRDEIKCAIEGNLCRCTGYQQIVDAVEMAAAMKREGVQSPDPTGPKSDPHPLGPDEPSLPPGSSK